MMEVVIAGLRSVSYKYLLPFHSGKNNAEINQIINEAGEDWLNEV